HWRFVSLSLNAPMTNAGGTIPLDSSFQGNPSRECYNCAPARIASGSVTTAPEPSSAVLVMAGMFVVTYGLRRLVWDTEAGAVSVCADTEPDIRSVAEIVNDLLAAQR